MKFLVTGGAGFIGSNIVEELLKQGHFVRVLDNFSTGKRENLKGIEVILHEAALPSVPRSINDPITTNEVNVTGTLNILDAAKDEGVKRIVYASSSSVYGNSPELPKREDMLPNPLSPYAVSKLAGEKYCQVFSKLYGIETVILRYFNVFGPRQDPNSQYSAVIPKFIKAIMNDEQPVIYGDGTQSRDFTYVKNVVDANILAATKDVESGLVMNCAYHEQITLNDLVKNINRILSKNIKTIYVDPRPGDIKHSFACIDMIKDKLGYTPHITFNVGINKAISFYK